jgi:hypothetical protein
MKKILLFPFVLLLALFAMSQTPVAYYPFSGNANDAAGTNHGTVNGAVLTTDRFGNANSAYSFDGVDDNISINNNAAFNFTNYTISLWFKYNGAGTAGKSIWSLISKNSNGNGFDDAFHIWVNATNKTTGGRVGNGSSEFYVGNPPAVDNGQWHHSALVFDNGNDLVRLYLDGVFISAVANTSNPFNNGGAIKIGYWEAFNNFFNGAIDEVKIYNTALTPAQVKQEFSLADYSSQFNNSVKMNGTTDNIDVNNSFTDQNFTVEMWLKPGVTQTTYADIIDNNHTAFQNWTCQQNDNNINQYIFGVHTASGGLGVVFNLSANVWQHLALIKGSTEINVFINGVLIQSTPWTGTVNFTNQFLRLGRWGGGGRNWNGSMDEVRYWNTARTQAQIVAAMNTQLTGSEAGLVGYWDMNRNGQGAGLTVDNKATATGAALNGTTVGTASTPIFELGVTQQKPGSGNAISFDGVDDVITVNNNSSTNFDINQDFTIDMWLKVPSTNQVNLSSTVNIILEKWGTPYSGVPSPFIIQYLNNTSGAFGTINLTRFNGTTFTGIGTTKTINDDKFHHLTFQKAGANLNVYLDGILDGTATDLISGTTQNNLPIIFGTRDNGTAKFNGSLDEVRIWNTALTQSQIRDRMCHKITSSDALYPNLVAYYNFDESTGNTVFDGTANNNNGTLTNSPTRVTSGAAIGTASSHDYVNATKTTSLTHPTGESFTVTSSSGNPDGIQIYRVDEQPNTLSGATGVGVNDKYFGVFQVNGTTPQYTAVYNYGGNPGVNIGNENQLRLSKRADNAATTWSILPDVANEAANTITVTGQSTEYILGKLGLALPVSIVSFSGTLKNQTVLLQWKVTEEINTAQFVIERSNGSNAFTTVGTRQPLNVGNTDYTLTDNTPFANGAVQYYRLKIMDKNGGYKYSNIIRISSQLTNQPITIFPNPVKDILTISGLKQTGTIKIISADGKMMQQQIVNAQTITLDMSNYAKGIYLLQYVVDGEVMSQKIIKQ